MSGSRHKARRAAVQALYQWDLTEQDPDQIESHFISEHNLTGADSEYFNALVRQVPLYHQELDSNIAPCLDREMENVDPVEKAILRIAAYELEYQKEIPYRVVLDEAIKLSKAFGSDQGYKFVNGVLDKLALVLRSEENADKS
ncbi:transcription antitermination factor NusB [Pseudomonadota bacterium]